MSYKTEGVPLAFITHHALLTYLIIEVLYNYIIDNLIL